MPAPTTPAEGSPEHLIEQSVRMTRLLHRIKSRINADGQDRSAFLLLFMVAANGPLRVADLAISCHVDASTVSRQAAELVRAGYFRREADPEDGRASLMALTDAGVAIADEVAARRREFFAEATADWDHDELRIFGSLFARFIDSLEHQHERLMTGLTPAFAARTTGQEVHA